MYGIYLILVLGVLVGAAAPTIATFENTINRFHETQLVNEVERAHDAVSEFRQRTGALPDDLDAVLLLLTNETEFDGRVRYAITRGVDGGPWRFDRAVVWANNFDTPIADATYLAGNDCGADAFAPAENWCAPAALRRFRLETRDTISKQLLRARTSIIETMSKISFYVPSFNTLPNMLNDGTPMTANTTYILADLVGYVGTAANCAGTFRFLDIALDCGDLFPPPFGAPLSYEFITDENVALLLETPILRNGGLNIIIGHELSI